MDRISQLRLENTKLRDKVNALEQKIISIVGLIELFPSGIEGKKEALNEKISSVINSTASSLKIITPKIGPFYSEGILNVANRGIPVLMIINDRRFIPPEFQQYYDNLKTKSNVSVVNNPNVKYLLVMNDKEVVSSAASLVKKELANSILIGTHVKEKNKLARIEQIFLNMLPSFMR